MRAGTDQSEPGQPTARNRIAVRIDVRAFYLDQVQANLVHGMAGVPCLADGPQLPGQRKVGVVVGVAHPEEPGLGATGGDGTPPATQKPRPPSAPPPPASAPTGGGVVCRGGGGA